MSLVKTGGKTGIYWYINARIQLGTVLCNYYTLVYSANFVYSGTLIKLYSGKYSGRTLYSDILWYFCTYTTTTTNLVTR